MKFRILGAEKQAGDKCNITYLIRYFSGVNVIDRKKQSMCAMGKKGRNGMRSMMEN
jgi:hypothetical protein